MEEKLRKHINGIIINKYGKYVNMLMNNYYENINAEKNLIKIKNKKVLLTNSGWHCYMKIKFKGIVCELQITPKGDFYLTDILNFQGTKLRIKKEKLSGVKVKSMEDFKNYIKLQDLNLSEKEIKYYIEKALDEFIEASFDENIKETILFNIYNIYFSKVLIDYYKPHQTVRSYFDNKIIEFEKDPYFFAYASMIKNTINIHFTGENIKLVKIFNLLYKTYFNQYLETNLQNELKKIFEPTNSKELINFLEGFCEETEGKKYFSLKLFQDFLKEYLGNYKIK